MGREVQRLHFGAQRLHSRGGLPVSVPAPDSVRARFAPRGTRRANHSVHLLLSGRAVRAALLLLLLGASPLGAGADAVPDLGGIRYPGGFDLNTVGDVQGRAWKLVVPEVGPVRFQLTSRSASYTVLTSPAWYWRRLGVRLAEGQEVLVQGSKALGSDGRLYVIAQILRTLPSGRTTVFRDNRGRPAWEARGSTAR